MKNQKEKFGQYMTPRIIAEFMVDLVSLEKDSKVLEPSAGDGIFIDVLKERGYNNILGYEVDPNIIQHDEVLNLSFISLNIDSDYDVIIGNPPYIRWKNLEDELKFELQNDQYWKKFLNSLNDYSAIFIIKSINALTNGGELIFITPDYWLYTTHSQNLRDFIVEKGQITEFYFFKESPIFRNVNVSLMVFKFVKNPDNFQDIKAVKVKSKTKIDRVLLRKMKLFNESSIFQVFQLKPFEKGTSWVFASENENLTIEKLERSCLYSSSNNIYDTLGDYCLIANGIVSGLDNAFNYDGLEVNSFESEHLIDVLKGKNIKPYYSSKTSKYIFLNFINTEYDEVDLKFHAPNFYKKLNQYKPQLLDRYSYNRSINYWEWVFLRNFKILSSGSERIFVPSKERITNLEYFRFSIAPHYSYPSQDVISIFKKTNTLESLNYVVAYLNTRLVFNWIKLKGIVKGDIVEFSKKPLSSVPFLRIDFDDDFEKMIHNEISDLVEEIKKTDMNNSLLIIYNDKIESLFNNLIDYRV